MKTADLHVLIQICHFLLFLGFCLSALIFMLLSIILRTKTKGLPELLREILGIAKATPQRNFPNCKSGFGQKLLGKLHLFLRNILHYRDPEFTPKMLRYGNGAAMNVAADLGKRNFMGKVSFDIVFCKLTHAFGGNPHLSRLNDIGCDELQQIAICTDLTGSIRTDVSDRNGKLFLIITNTVLLRLRKNLLRIPVAPL